MSAMNNLLMKCELCPRFCKVNRYKQLGYCKSSDKVKLALVSLHQWEEPPLVGEKGAGTIFFSNCNLHCKFCQNHQISQEGFGKEIDIERLAEIFLEQQKRGAATIDLVTPTHYVPQIIEALKIAKANNLHLPIVYNSNAYENVETIELLKGYVDIFLPDLKYFDDELAIKYSSAPNYFKVATSAIKKMFEIVDRHKLIIRHLILPTHYRDSIKIVDWIYNTFGDDVYISLMNQFTPIKQTQYKELNRRLTAFEYQKVINHAIELGIKNCYMQVGKTSLESFIPIFDLSGI